MKNSTIIIKIWRCYYDSLEFFNFFPQNLWIQMQSFSLKSWLSRYADVWILFFLNIFFYKDWNQHAGYMNWDVNFFGDFLHTGNCEKLGIENVWNKKNNFHEGQRCFAGEKSTVVLIPQCCCSIFVARIKGRFFFLYTCM